MEQTPPLSILAIDGHVHIYKQYDWADAVQSLVSNLGMAAKSLVQGGPPPILIGLLAESKSNRFYHSVLEMGAPLSKGALEVAPGPDAGSLVIRDQGVIKGYLIAGRQIVTSEKLEVLSLGTDISLPDGNSLEATLSSITAQGAVPILSWSPGKWLFKRGRVVESTLMSHSPGSFLIGDIGLRPGLLPLPSLMKLAHQRGFKMIDGSDPLPLAGEERWIGRNGFQVMGSFDPQTPAASVRTILLNPASAFTPLGVHSSLVNFAARWGRYQLRS